MAATARCRFRAGVPFRPSGLAASGSHTPPMKRKELFWMIVPCLLLIGAGAYFSRRPAKEFRIVIDEVKQVPVTPYDISQGWDTRIVFKQSVFNVPEFKM